MTVIAILTFPVIPACAGMTDVLAEMSMLQSEDMKRSQLATRSYSTTVQPIAAITLVVSDRL